MFSFYRLIPHCISKNVRTLFCETTKLSPATDEMITNIVGKRKTKKPKTGNHDYQTLRHNNIQVLNVRNPSLEDKSVGYTIVVDVGSDDSPSDYLGLPRLLQYAINKICKSCGYNFSSLTGRFHTVYSFETTPDNHGERLRTWAERLFLERDLVGDDVKDINTERWRVHHEFNEKRVSDVHGSACRILGSCKIGTHFPQFPFVNSETLGLHADELLKKLNKVRELYRQRPVVICTYSAHELDMETIVKSINVGHFLSKGKPPHTVQKPRKEDENITKSLIVAKSQNDRRNLILIFPMMKKLNVQERNTFNWIAQMINWKTDGLLVTKLRDYKLATGCTAKLQDDNFIISVDLTDHGLKQIRCVCDTVKNYLDFLCGQWTRDTISRAIEHMKREEDDRFHLQTNMEKSAYIATCLNGNIEEFDYELLHSGLDGEHLISERLLKNKNIAHTIYDRSPSHVLAALMDEYTGCLPTIIPEPSVEKEYGIPFYIVESSLFETNGDDYCLARCCMFMWMEFKPHPNQRWYYFSLGHPQHAAFNMLFEMHFHYCFDRYESLFGGITMSKDHQRLSIETNTMESYNALRSIITDFDDKFSIVKEDTLADMSRTMSNSETFAESLMETTVDDHHCKFKIYPIHVQYKAVIDMDYAAYWGYFFQMDRQKHAINCQKINNHEPFNAYIQFNSINSNDAVTTTLFFYQTSQLFDKSGRLSEKLSALHQLFINVLFTIKEENELYTAEVIRHQRYTHAHGFLLKILSVEKNKDIKKIKKICDKLHKEVADRSETEYTELNLKVLYDNIVRRRVKIQVIGHKNPKINEQQTFEKQFDNWFIKTYGRRN